MTRYCGCGRPTHKGSCHWWRRTRRPQKTRRDKGTGMSPAELREYKTAKQREYRRRAVANA